jgi:hypothetical protein
MEKITALGIFSHYKSLAFGEKDKLIVTIAKAIGKSSSAVRRKIEKGVWNEMTEIPIVDKIIRGEA